ncbi:PQQ-binding-like beta-propeller repeat protein [Streptomyces sp. NPDC058657]|uniref:outer membrane protein assembly factor BamB family protein n=1 Tax=unclassified Streptomyces TaxID=2593676 RepID=UPI00365AD44F
MAEDGHRGVPRPGVPSRKQGRPPKDLTGLGGAQREFADIIRKEFFDRLSRLGVTTAQISAALNEKSEGFSGPSLSKYRSGERIPDRDKLLRLLAYAEEVADQPLPEGVRELVLEKYSAVLRETNPQLHHFYELLDEREQMVTERDVARKEHRRTRDQLVECRSSLEQALGQVKRLDAEVKQAEREELRRQEREDAAENEVVRLQEEQEQLLRAVRRARSEQQAARREIQRLQSLLVQQAQEAARSEAGLKDENAGLAAEVSAAAVRSEKLEHSEQALRAELDQVTAALEQAEVRSGELASRYAVVLRSRAVVSKRLSLARVQRRDLEDKQAALVQREAVTMRQLTAAERRVADLEARLVAAFRSRDALLEDPAAPERVVAEAVEAVDAAWQSYEGEISRIEQHVVVSPAGTTTASPAGTNESADEEGAAPAAATEATEEGGEPPSAPPERERERRPRVRPVAASTGDTGSASGGTVRSVKHVDLTAWAMFGGLVLLVFLITTLWPQGWWPRDTSGAKDNLSQDDGNGGEETKKVGPQWSSVLPYPLNNKPVLDGTVVITTAWQGAAYGIDATTGRRLWTVPLTKNISGPPVTSGGLAHVRSSYNELKTVDSRSGKVRWEDPDFAGSLAAAPGLLVKTVGNEVVSLRPHDGKVLWSTKLDAQAIGSPVLTKDTVYVSARTGLLYALNAETGAVRWRKDVSGKDATRGPFIAGGAVIANADKEIVALDTRSGRELWRRSHTIDVYMSAMEAASDVLIFTEAGKDGRALTAVDLKEKRLKWVVEHREKSDAQPLALSAFADRLYVAYDSQKLCAHTVAEGTLVECFTIDNTLADITATADGVYVTSYNQRLYFFQKGAFG